MVISKNHARSLEKQGRAKIEKGYIVLQGNGDKYQMVTRYDLQRVDHYLIVDEDE